MTRTPKPKRPLMAHPWMFGCVVLAICALGALAYVWTLPKAQTVKGIVANPTPTPSPGHQGNPGDSAKEEQTPTPTPSPHAETPQPITVSGFSVTAQSGGGAHASDYINGAQGGTCTLTLTSPHGDQNQVPQGTLVWAGQYYDCAFSPEITGVTEAGSWSAVLTVSGTNGATGSASAKFQVH